MSRGNADFCSLTADQLLEAVYAALCGYYGGEPRILPTEIRSEMASHLDGLHPKPEYSAYSEVLLVPRPKKGRLSGVWALAMGRNWRPHARSVFSCEIVAVPVTTAGRSLLEADSDICAALQRERDFHNALVIAWTDGDIGANAGRFGSEMVDFLEEFKEEILHHPEPKLYKLGSVVLIFEAIRQTLNADL